MNTPLWLTLLVAALGPAAALLGVWLTQRRADRRDDATFARELKRERERWQREDEARTFENRRVAYVEFFEALRKMHQIVELYAMANLSSSNQPNPLDSGWNTETWEKLNHLEIYGTPNVTSLATQAYYNTMRWGDITEDRGFYTADYQNRTDAVDDSKAALLQAIRGELGIPDATNLKGLTLTASTDDPSESPVPLWFLRP